MTCLGAGCTSKGNPINRIKPLAIFLHVFLGIGALGGGLALMLFPKGMETGLTVDLLKGSPFSNYFVPGLSLFLFLGVLPLVCAVSIAKQSNLTGWTLCGVGAILMIWMLVEIASIGFSMSPPLQPFYLVYAVVMMAFGVRSLLDDLRRR
jgi:hypothetical protein